METPRAGLRPYFPLAAGVLINLSTGILYAWSVFVAPLEAALGADRATVSGAQSLCLFTATIGCFVMHRLLRWFTLPQLTLVTGAVTAAGFALAGFGQSVAALYIGYGVLFGFAVGVVYFVAMTAVSIEGPVRPSIAMSINMSAVAMGGIAWSPGLAILIEATGPEATFGVTAAVSFLALAIAAGLIALSRKTPPPATGASGLFQDMLTDRPRVVIMIFLGFVCIAFTALAVIGHAATMMAAWGASSDQTQLAPMLSSAGYAIGGLVGGLLVDALTGRRVLAGVGARHGGVSCWRSSLRPASPWGSPPSPRSGWPSAFSRARIPSPSPATTGRRRCPGSSDASPSPMASADCSGPSAQARSTMPTSTTAAR